MLNNYKIIHVSSNETVTNSTICTTFETLHQNKNYPLNISHICVYHGSKSQSYNINIYIKV